MIGITGASGGIGGRTARILVEEGNTGLRLLGRDISRLPDLGTESGRADFGDPLSLETSFQGLDTLFFVAGHEGPERVNQHRNVVQAAVGAGVKRIVYLSFLGASATCSSFLDEIIMKQRL